MDGGEHLEEREIFRKLMKKQLEPGELYEQLRAMKVRATYENAIYFQMVRKAAGGDLSAAKYILEAVRGEEQRGAEAVDLAEVSTADLKRMIEGEWEAVEQPRNCEGAGQAGAGQTQL